MCPPLKREKQNYFLKSASLVNINASQTHMMSTHVGIIYWGCEAQVVGLKGKEVVGGTCASEIEAHRQAQYYYYYYMLRLTYEIYMDEHINNI